MRRFLTAAFMVIALVVSTAPAFAQDGTATGAAVKSPDEMLKESDELWKTRHVKGNAQKSMDIAKEALKAGGNEFESRWRIARGAFWVAEWSTDKKVKEKLGWEGWEYAIKCTELQPNRVEGYYWATLCVGQYSMGISIVSAVFKGIDRKFEKNCAKAIQINAKYDFGGPDRAMGIYWRDLPKIKQDLAKAEKHMKASIANGDAKIRSHFYLAEIYLMTGKKDGAKAELERCSAMDPKAEDYPDGIIFKKKCAELLKKEFPAAPAPAAE